MAVDYQVLFNIILGVAGALGLWVLNTMSKTMERLDQDVRGLPEKYVPKNDFQQALHDLKDDVNAGLVRVEKSIDAIFRKLDGKEDKSASIGQRKDP